MPKGVPKSGKREVRHPEMPRPHEYSPLTGKDAIKTKPGDNSKYAGILLAIHSWGPVDRKNVEQLEARFWDFVTFCGENDIRVTNQLAYYAMGITKDDVYDWAHGRSGSLAHTDLVKKVKAFCATYREMLGAEGKINPVTLVWWQKNYDGFVDKTEMVVTPNNPLGATMDVNEIEAGIAKALPAEDSEA